MIYSLDISNFLEEISSLSHSVVFLYFLGSQKTRGVTGKFGLGMRNEPGQRLVEFCKENALVIASTLFQQHKKRLYTWTSPDGQHRNQIQYILCSQRWRSSIWSVKIRPGVDCGSDHELLTAKFRLKLKTAEKTTRPFRYDLIKSYTRRESGSLRSLYKWLRKEVKWNAKEKGKEKDKPNSIHFRK